MNEVMLDVPIRKFDSTREATISFIKDCPDSGVWKCKTDIFDGAAYIARMRITITRFKQRLATKKARLPEFKLVVVSIEHISGENAHDIITLQKRVTKTQETRNALIKDLGENILFV